MKGAIAAGPESEAGAAVGHVDGEGAVVFEHVFEIGEIAVDVGWGALGMVDDAPGIEPAGVEFAAHEGPFGENFAECFECVGGIGSEVDDGEEVAAVAILQVFDGIAGEERDVEAGVEEGLAEFAHVLGVSAEEAIFIFDLDHEDGPAVGDLKRREFFADALEVIFDGGHVAGVAGAEFDSVVLEEPPGEAAHFPFGAGVGTGAEDNPESFFLGDAAELGDVGLAGEVEFAGLGFLHVPEHVGADRVEPHGAGHLEAVAPVFLGDARGVDFAAADLECWPSRRKSSSPMAKVCEGVSAPRATLVAALPIATAPRTANANTHFMPKTMHRFLRRRRPLLRKVDP